MNDELRDAILSAFEEVAEAQLRAIRRLRRGVRETPGTARGMRTSQIDMAKAILNGTGRPLHISELLAGIRLAYGVAVDRESLVSSLTKRVARGDRFIRTARNTFALRPEGSGPA